MTTIIRPANTSNLINPSKKVHVDHSVLAFSERINHLETAGKVVMEDIDKYMNGINKIENDLAVFVMETDEKIEEQTKYRCMMTKRIIELEDSVKTLMTEYDDLKVQFNETKKENSDFKNFICQYLKNGFHK